MLPEPLRAGPADPRAAQVRRTARTSTALENGQKRWIKDIDTFLAEGHVWEDVRFVSCEYLRSIPDGPPIPEDAGPPPQP